MSAVAKDIRQAGPNALAITWSDGLASSYDVRELRLSCPCAACVDEMTGQRTLDPDRVPQGVVPARIRSVGNYAISIAWSDGHDTGIYSWTLLRRLAGLP